MGGASTKISLISLSHRISHMSLILKRLRGNALVVAGQSFDTAGPALQDPLQTELSRLFKWQKWAILPIGLLLLLWGAQRYFIVNGLDDGRAFVNTASRLVLLGAVVPWLATLGLIYRTGRIAFGMASGLFYLLLALLLVVAPCYLYAYQAKEFPGFVLVLSWPGFFIIPIMLQLDIARQPAKLDALIEQMPRPAAAPSTRRPGFGFFSACGWYLAFWIARASLYAFLRFGFGPLPNDGPQGFLYLLAGILSQTYTVFFIVTWNLGRDVGRVLALRAPTMRHLVFSILLVLPCVLLSSDLLYWTYAVCELIGIERFEMPPSIFRYSFLRGQASILFAIVLTTDMIFVALTEEVFWRGFVGGALVARYGRNGILLTAALFSAAHLRLAGAPGLFLDGVLLQLLFLATRSLFAPIVFHALFNCLPELISIIFGLWIPRLESGRLPLPLVLLAIANLAFLCRLLYKTRVRWRLPNRTNWSPGFLTAEMPPADLQARPKSRRPKSKEYAILSVLYLGLVGVILIYSRHR
jgi:membrane protease YdiL (CAAX protease family)